MTLVVVLGVSLAACGGKSSSASHGGPPSSPTTSPDASPQLPPEHLTFGVTGSTQEVAAFRRMTASFSPLDRHVTVRTVSWPDDAAMMADLRTGTAVPDVFLASRRDLAWLQLHQVIQPVDQLLDDRGVDFGDTYPRGALTGFAGDNHLMCLPYSIEPSVVYYNTRLLRLRQIRNNPPTPGEGWSLDQFRAAARWAVRNNPGVAGLYVAPSLSGLVPFLYSGGGQLFDNASQPTSLALSSGSGPQAITQSMRVLADPALTLTPAQLGQATPLQYFERGELAMLVGSRELVPKLRAHPDLHFDVMPMPTLGSPATAGNLNALCISSTAKDAGTAADFLVYASSPPALSEVARTGYLQPANQNVALSNAFQQPGKLPRHAAVFTFSVKSMVQPPLIDGWDQLGAAVGPLVGRLFHTTGAHAILRQTRRIDRVSRPVLKEFAPQTPSPTATESAQSGG